MRRHQSLLACGALAAAAALTLSGCSGTASGDTAPSDASETATLTFASYGGAFQDAQIEAWQKPYTAETGVDFENTSPSDPAQIKAQVMAGNTTWDVVDVDPYFAAEQCGVLVEEIEVPGIDSGLYNPQTLGDCFIGAYQYATIFMYNEETYGADAPSSIADFFDVDRFPGKRGLVPTVRDGILELALLADGVDPDALYPLDVDRALSVYDTIRDDTIFAENNGALLQLSVDQQVDMVLMVAARAKATLDEGAPFTPVWDITMTNFGSLVVPKGSPNKEAAEEFIGFAVQTPQAEAFAELSGTSPITSDAQPELSANGEKVNAFGDANTGDTRIVNLEWWAQHYLDTQNRFTVWLNG